MMTEALEVWPASLLQLEKIIPSRITSLLLILILIVVLWHVEIVAAEGGMLLTSPLGMLLL
jgi:hypothetical protein